MARKPLPAVGACYVVELQDGRFGACQVLNPSRTGCEVVCLDWVGDRPPTLADLDDAAPLIIDHHRWNAHEDRLNVDARPPAALAFIGVTEPKAALDAGCNSYGSWDNFGLQLYSQHRWDHEVPEAERRAYKDAVKNPRRKVTIRFGGQDINLRNTFNNVTIGPDEQPLTIPLDAPPEWDQLDAFPLMTKLHYEGRDPGVIDHVAGRMLIRELTWLQHNQKSIDLSAAELDRAIIEVGKAPMEIIVDGSLERLAITGRDAASCELKVRHPRDGQGLTLFLDDRREMPAPVAGLERLSALVIRSPRVLDARAAAAYEFLESLNVVCSYGALIHARELRLLSHLRELVLGDIFDMDVDELPTCEELPLLQSVCFDGLTKADAVAIRKRYRGIASLSVRGAKSDAWLRANVDNPFNPWLDEQPARGAAACKAYKRASTRIAKLSGSEDLTFELEVATFIAAFVRIAKKHGIDEGQGEEIRAALTKLASESAFEPSDEQLQAWFEEGGF